MAVRPRPNLKSWDRGKTGAAPLSYAAGEPELQRQLSSEDTAPAWCKGRWIPVAVKGCKSELPLLGVL